MCLLDEVLDWNPSQLRCRSRAHRLLTNPLRLGHQLSAVCGIEFAAQAMAVHGALVQDELAHSALDNSEEIAEPRHGYLMSLRQVNIHTLRLDDISGDLEIFVERIGGDGVTVIYEFRVDAQAHQLLSGRAAVLTNAVTAGGDFMLGVNS